MHRVKKCISHLIRNFLYKILKKVYWTKPFEPHCKFIREYLAILLLKFPEQGDDVAGRDKKVPQRLTQFDMRSKTPCS